MTRKNMHEEEGYDEEKYERMSMMRRNMRGRNDEEEYVRKSMTRRITRERI